MPDLPYLRGSNSLTERVHYFFLARGDEGATDDELEVAMELRHQTASSRRRDLELHGLLEWTGKKRKARWVNRDRATL